MNDSTLSDFEIHVSTERTHLSQVRRAFTKSLEIQNADPGLVNFFVVCSSYLEFALNRLIVQDYVLHDLLVPHIEESNAEYQDKLRSLDKGLKAMESSIEKLGEAKKELIESGLYGVEAFKEEAHAFLDVFLNLLASNRHSTYDLEKEVFTSQDWEKIAGVTEDSIEKEQVLYQEIKLSAPEGCDPESFPPIGHHAKPE
tara:strand:- start:763 stop:1359 length:597 start_codon:yes stop_codon:yes gene_type:complete